MTVVDQTEDKVVVFFDIDNTLYSKGAGVHDLMQEYIHRYFVTHLDLDDESAEQLHQHYYRDFGLALEGLVRFHQVDALEYNKEVDDALPLPDILKRDQRLRALLEAFDPCKVEKLWLFTNAYKTHGKRVVRLLGIEDLFSGITYCDYSQRPLLCKPMKPVFDRALKEAGVTDPSKCVFIDDSPLNIKAAKNFGWGTTVLFAEEGLPENPVGDYQIQSLHELPKILPHIFKA